MDGEVQVVVLPCAHTYLCVECADAQGGVQTCAICRRDVVQVVKLFFA